MSLADYPSRKRNVRRGQEMNTACAPEFALQQPAFRAAAERWDQSGAACPSDIKLALNPACFIKMKVIRVARGSAMTMMAPRTFLQYWEVI
jgi:hypothetical protein